MNVLDPAAITATKYGYFAKSAQDGRYYLVTSDGAIPATGSRILTTLDAGQLTYIGSDHFITYAAGAVTLSTPVTPAVVGTNFFEGRMSGLFFAGNIQLGLGIGMSRVFDPATLFANGEVGVWYDPSDLSTVWQDAARTIPGAVGEVVGCIDDKSGNGFHATQANTASKPMYQTAPDRLTLDKVDDRLLVTVPTGGFVGTMVLATPQGTAAYGVNIPAGSYAVGGTTTGGYFPGTAIQDCVIRNGAMTQGEIDLTIAYMLDEGDGLDYGAVMNFSNYWRNRTEITSFPLINTSAGTDFSYAWRNCTSLTSFPLIDTSAGTNFSYAWRNCSSLTSFPANFFDGCAATNFDNAFTTTNLNQSSIDGVLVSINSNGTSNGTFKQSDGSAPSATGRAAITAMRSRGWTVTVTGGF
jgi:hypothetical protein